MTEPSGSCPAHVDALAYLTDADTELRRCAATHWWAEGLDQHGTATPWVLGWEANRELLADRRLSPRSFADDMVASGLSPATSFQVAPLFSRHGADHRCARAAVDDDGAGPDAADR